MPLSQLKNASITLNRLKKYFEGQGDTAAAKDVAHAIARVEREVAQEEFRILNRVYMQHSSVGATLSF